MEIKKKRLRNKVVVLVIILLFTPKISHAETNSNTERDGQTIINMEDKPIIELLSEEPGAELNVPFFEIIYAITPTTGSFIDEVFVKVDGEFDRYLFRSITSSVMIEPGRKIADARLFLPTESEAHRFELVAIDSTGAMATYSFEEPFYMNESPGLPALFLEDITTYEADGVKKGFVNNRIHLEIDRAARDEQFPTLTEQLLDSLITREAQLLAGPDQNDRVTIEVAPFSFEEFHQILFEIRQFSSGLIKRGALEEIDPTTVSLDPRDEKHAARPMTITSDMVQTGWVPGLFLRKYQANLLRFKFTLSEENYLLHKYFPSTDLGRSLFYQRADDAVRQIDGIRVIDPLPMFPYIWVELDENSPNELIEKAQKVMRESADVFDQAEMVLINDFLNGEPFYEEVHRQVPVVINVNGTVGSLSSVKWIGITPTMKSTYRTIISLPIIYLSFIFCVYLWNRVRFRPK